MLLERTGLTDGPGLRRALRAALVERRRTAPAALAGEHVRLFEGAVPCPINETAYLPRDRGAILADVCGFYRAFGFEPAAASGEKPDHLACELEFLAMLLVMAGRAAAAGERERQRVTEEAMTLFARDHLGEWLGPFCERLEHTTELAALRLAADLARRAWRAIALGMDLPAPGAPVAARNAAEDGSPYECGLADPGPVAPLTIEGAPPAEPR
jgi:TorA maturation chaperone TorD